ncbi:Cyclic nucleotide-binding and PilZ domains-containing protein [Desulfonema limicola]|uniref:Cyclic nucleotide-binding and PilZ domains-containing protein n=1 Tax=Desulfonema limicola TaxID=45656 RepID=A0A975B670_9BACT|nr:cyclic nucleotide-binding domain-containing protein [Desulfonema limicola]QTA79492.1 Cyclic nucleotide-binding and PilZ domains-containing protein [Desulfonema limicola]
MNNDLAKQERLIDTYVQQQRTEEAVELLFQLIVNYAREKNFIKAEALREKLFEIDSMALTQIIKSAEIIEEEKSESVDSNHMDIWSDFYKNLTTEETNIFYFALTKKIFHPDEVVFSQGDINDKLWFVDQGQLKMVYSQKGVEKLIKTMGPGSLAGEDTFFSISVCTTSLTALGRTGVNYLNIETYNRWQTEFPTLASKVELYCSNLMKNAKLLQEKGLNRREHRRIKISGTILFQVLNREGKPIGKAFKGDLSDISIGGLSFFIKTSNRKNALMLLGRKLNVKFSLPMGKTNLETKQKGTITGVINHLFRDYSIHMRFDNLLSRLVVEEMQLIQDAHGNKESEKADKSIA